jgi:hypothetical protein
MPILSAIMLHSSVSQQHEKGLGLAASALLYALMPRSAWKDNSPKFGVSLVSWSTYCSGAHTLT